ncbi:hypothetical protein M3Y97_00093500 [Aphelenchoides bicaudatus]|nr:hypothetical protein M3Y97_00093500 [Aphelenchoides bicaudatus]
MAKLERVLGCTACSSSIVTEENTGLVAYPCGSTVVISNPRTSSQAHLISTSKNNITTVGFSPCGRYLVTGEFGCDPMVRIWELNRDGQSFGQQVAELKEHKIGIMNVIFSKDSKQIISVGNQHDKSVIVWDWRAQRKLTESRLSSQVYAIAMSYTGNMFVTVGSRHVKFWFLETANQRTTLQGRSAILSDQRNNTFIDVCCAPNNRTFALTVAKQLIEFHDKKLANIYELDGGGVPYSLSMGIDMLLVGFGNGRIRGLDLNNLDIVFEAPLPHYLKVDLTNALESTFFENAPQNAESYPDVHALSFHSKSKTITALYSDRSVYHWQILDNGQIVKVSSHLFHVGTVHDVCVVRNNQTPYLPAGSFLTCGADETVRIWNIEKDLQSSILPSNVLSNELRKVLYLSQQGTNTLTEQHGKNFGAVMADALDTTLGIRCLRLSFDGKHLSCGLRNGNIMIFDVTDLKFNMISEPIEAHEQEVRCLEYTDPSCGHNFLASGSRDRLVHLFDAANNYSHLSVIEDHQSTVHSIIFSFINGTLNMITSSTDKLVIIRKLTEDSSGVLNFERVEQINIKNGPNHLVMTPEKNLLTAGSDRHLRAYTINGKELSDVNGTMCDSGTLSKICIDPSGTFAATVCSDRFVYIVDIVSGECVAVLSGQSDGITAISFTPDCRRLIVVSFSGCIFIWRLSNLLTKRMLAKLSRLSPNLLHGLGENDRCATPDSLIESGSDSASAIGTKKDAHASSEFGSLNSLNVAQDDDLDSGVGLRSYPAVLNNRAQSGDKKSFVVKKVSVEVVRRSNSNLHNALTASIGDLQIEAGDEPEVSTPMIQNAYATQQPGPFPVGPNYATSRSMSNLHRHAVSPQRNRRRWNVPSGMNDQSYDQSSSYASPTQMMSPPQAYAQNSSMNTSSPYGNESLVAPRFSMNTSMSLNTLRGSLAGESQPLATSSPQYQHQQSPAYGHQRHQSPASAYQQFDRNGQSRNSISKRYLSHVGEPESHTVWSPNGLKQRKNSSLFNPATPSRRLSTATTNNDNLLSTSLPTNQRLFKPRQSSTPTGQNNNSVDGRNSTKPGRLLAAKWIEQQQRRSSTSDSNTQHRQDDANNEMPATTAAEMYKNLRSRSQSPSQLALQMAEQQSRKLSSTLQRRRESDTRSVASRITPSSSRSNLRAISNLNNSSHALNKLLQSREQLKKSQENLLLAAGMNDDDPVSSASTPMSRSRSIGNLKLSTVRPNGRSLNNNTFGGLSTFDENLHKLSNPDLTALDNYSKNSSTTGDNSTPEPAYYSTTLPKSLRKGAVQKRLERNVPQRTLRVDQTTSGDSDSDILPMVKKGTVFQRANQFRSISSVDNTTNVRGRSNLLTTVPQKTNYLNRKADGGVDNKSSKRRQPQ